MSRPLLALLALFFLALVMPSARAAMLTVTNTNDSGSGSLRAAIATANTDGGDDTITFSLPGRRLPADHPEQHAHHHRPDDNQRGGRAQPHH